jgi:cytochrome c
MKRSPSNILILGIVLTTTGLWAQSMRADEALARTSGCLACHGIAHKIVGPSFKDIAAKYKDNPAAVDSLMRKVKQGGSGVWGHIPMPPNTHVSNEDTKALVEWILTR